jgi:hypothetical protein
MNKVPESIAKELAALAAKPESDIDFSDIPATTAKDWQCAVRGKFYRPIKQQLTVRVAPTRRSHRMAQESGQRLSKPPE